MRKATRTQWIKCSIAILLYLIFLIWVKSWWGLIVVPFIFDVYITKKIPSGRFCFGCGTCRRIHSNP